MSQSDNEVDRWRATQSKLNKLFVHDLKNPISALSANLSFLETAMVSEPEDVRGALSDSVLASEMLLRFAENLNLISMLEVGENCGMSQISLDAFVRSVVRRSQKFANSAGIRIEIEEPLADARLVFQYRYAELVVDNLILSAIRHSPQGSEVLVSTAVNAPNVTISICDHGRPVQGEFKQSLLTRESQSEAKKHSGSRYGRGLGLYAVGLATKALEGEITIGIKEGMTEFALTIPLSSDE